MVSGSQSEIDYAARSAFLNATTDVMNPAPIDTLLDVLPAFKRWFGGEEHTLFDLIEPWKRCLLPAFERLCGVEEQIHDQNAPAIHNENAPAVLVGDVVWLQLIFWDYGRQPDRMAAHHPGYTDPAGRFSLEAKVVRCSISQIENSKATEVNGLLSRWLAKYHFRDHWLRDVALCTLLESAAGLAAPRTWHVDIDWCFPALEIPRIEPRAERPYEYLGEFDKAYREVRKKYVRAIQFQLGERANHLRPARWTAAIFAGSTFARLAKTEASEDTIRKAVRAFARRAGLTLPRNTITRPCFAV